MYRRLTLITLFAVVALALAVTGAIAMGNSSGLTAAGATMVGTGFTYQGSLSDGGNPADGFYDFEFSLFDAASGGSQVGATISFDNLLVADGLFSTTLDFGAVFDGTDLWLEIGVRPGSDTGPHTVLTPRQALTPAPYALFAPNAGNASTADTATTADTANAAPWSGLTGVPAGFADGVDDDTTYTAGTGLSLAGGEFSLDTSFTDGLYWSLGGNAGTNPASDFLGTTDNVALNIGVNDTTVMELSPDSGTPSVLFTVNAGDTKVVSIGERYRDNAVIAWAKIADTFSQLALSEDYGVASLARCTPSSVGCYILTLTDTGFDAGTLIPVAIAEIDEQPDTAAEVRIVSVDQVGMGASAVFHVYINDGTFAPVNNDFVFIVTGR